MRDYRVLDLRWTDSGDLTIGQGKDLGDTSRHSLLSFLQEVKTRIRSELYDWKLQPHIGASLIDLIGEPNDSETAEEGKTRIIAALTKDNLVDAGLLNVVYMPTGIHHLLYRISIRLPELQPDEAVTLSVLLDVEDFEVQFL
jgi:hypothetical protein